MNKRNVFPILAILNGSVIAIMINFNKELAEASGLMFSIVVIHLVGGLLATSIILILRPKIIERPHPLLRVGGLFGVALVFMNTLCFQNIGASLTLATVVLGQSITAFIADTTGFLGVKTYKFDRKKLIGFLISLSGIIIMASRGSFELLYIVLAFISGGITITQMIINARLASKIGLLRATRNNFTVAIILSIVLCILLSVPLKESFSSLPEIPLLIVIGGGSLGVIAVFMCNWIIPKIPTVYSTLLQFSGQIIAAIILDAIRYGEVPLNQIIGILFILLGMYWNIRIDRIAQANGSDR